MDASSLEELLFDPLKCSKLSVERKREIVYEVSNWADSATDILHTWSRQDILQILCAEIGKERKYTGLTKTKIIEHLLKIVYEKKSQEGGTPNTSEAQTMSENGERTPKRPRKSDHPTRLPVPTPDVDLGSTVYCKNSACKANLNREDSFCKRCSCCICRQYDDNKDPSLWLICSSDPPYHSMPCGMSCHLECAFLNENSGISSEREDKRLDGSFRCVSCGKLNDLLGCWRKQLVVARDTRRVDILCYRLSLCQKILAGTKDYQNLCEFVDEAVLKLEEDVGPLTGLPVKKARGIVNRLSSGPEIQRLCASAVESLDLLLSERLPNSPSDCNAQALNLVRIEEVLASSIRVALDDSKMGNVVCCTLWHRKADDKEYPPEATCRLSTADTKFLLSNLTPATDYFLKVIILDKDKETGLHEFQFTTESSENGNSKSSEEERSQSPATNCSSLSNPSSVEDETNNADNNKTDKDEEKVNKETGPIVEEKSSDNGSNTPRPGLECVPHVESLQITPCKKENEKEGGDGRKSRRKRKGVDDDLTKKDEEEPQAGSSSKKRREEGNTGIGDKDFEYYVKVVRWLECDGHIETEFRQKFLTWYSLRATPQEVRIVKVFIDTFIEDPDSLAEQLVDTFNDVISNKRCCTVPSGFCLKLWH